MLCGNSPITFKPQFRQSLPLFLSHIFFTSRKILKLVSKHTDERTNKQKQPLIFPSSALTAN